MFHPCSQMKDYEKLPPIVVKKGEGVYLIDENGKKYMDCVSSWWVNLFGHCNKRINRALNRQLENLEHTIFANFTHEPAIELGERLIEVAPKGLKKLIFSENGSSAVEIALKISFQYHQEKGDIKRTKFVSLKNAYHGETLGALGVTDVNLFTELYKPLIKEALKVEGPDCYRCRWGKTSASCDAECFVYMEELLEKNGDEIAGIIIEPMVQGAAGMNIYSPKYLKKLRELTLKKGVHLIADEIAVGFGRTGKMFACEHAEISPDIMCVGKGLTAGYFPMALTLITDEIYSMFYKDYLDGGSFLHSHSYSGNPLGCSVAVETLKIFKEENILSDVKEKAQYLEKKAKEIFENHKNIGEYRQIGFIGALELLKKKEKKESFKSNERATYEIYKIGLEKGIVIRPLGDVIYFMPPYTIKLDKIDFMLKNCLESIDEYLIKREEVEKKNQLMNNFVGFEV
ncbi:MAG: adenosylmethionine--8-amino-7-oxononanoate transaminase [Fusobacteriaceae bacterium]